MDEYPLCPFCKTPVNPNARLNVYHEEAGWVQTRTGGGTHALALRAETGRFAHRGCVDDRRRGISTGQESLL